MGLLSFCGSPIYSPIWVFYCFEGMFEADNDFIELVSVLHTPARPPAHIICYDKMGLGWQVVEQQLKVPTFYDKIMSPKAISENKLMIQHSKNRLRLNI